MCACTHAFSASHVGVDETFEAEISIPTKRVQAAVGIAIVFANVGQGNGVFLKNKQNGKTLILDAGYSALPINVSTGDSLSAEELEDQLTIFLISYLPTVSEDPRQSYNVIVTHPDKDHVTLLNKFYISERLSFADKIQDFYLGGDISHYKKEDAVELLECIIRFSTTQNTQILSHLLPSGMHVTDFLEALKGNTLDDILNENRRPYIMHLIINSFLTSEQVSRGGRLEFLGINAYANIPDAHICNDNDSYDKCLSDTNGTLGGSIIGAAGSEAVNGSSAVVRLVLGHTENFIFTGDATGKTTERILECRVPEKLKSSILLASHHGASTHGTNSAEWVTATQPEVVVFSAGFHGQYKHPRFEAVANYLQFLENEIAVMHPLILHNLHANIGEMLKLGIIHPFHFFTTPTGWLTVGTTKNIYTTSSPPRDYNALVFIVNADGKITDRPVY